MKKIMEKLEWLVELGGMKRDITFLILSGIALLLSILKVVPLPFDIAWIAIILCGVPIILEAIIGLVTAFDIKADVLVSLALIASVIMGEYFAAGEVAFIMQIGALLEELTVARAQAGIEKLVHLTPQTARVLSTDGKEEKVIAAKDVKVGDILRVLPGETIPVDGVILSGQTSINQAVMTGESMPVDKTTGDEVSSGTVNQFGSFDMKATKVGEDSSIQRMIRLVQSADASKAKIVNLADSWATWIVVIALVSALFTWLITGKVIRAVTILVVFCPCALVLATPTAIVAAIGNATKHGFLVREGDALERLAKVSKITFDKTGTLTMGTPQVVDVVSVLPEMGKEKLFALCAAAESRSEHPLAKAIVRSYKETGKVFSGNEIEEFEMIPGHGVKAVVSGQTVMAGNPAMFEKKNIVFDKNTVPEAENAVKHGETVVYVAINERFAGILCLSDTLRKESPKLISSLKQDGIVPVLLTGDNEMAAMAMAEKLDIQEVYAECRPETKLERIDQFQQKGELVCMIGDGINDAPALKKAHVGIAMGGIGSDIAVDAADIALVDDEIKEVPHLMGLAKKMMTKIKLNLTFSMTLNFVAIILAMTGILNPVIGALVHNCGSVLVIINSALLLGWKRKCLCMMEQKRKAMRGHRKL